jgi:anaerobic ribonucleoside-triphosphate reductase activating protein
MGYATTDKTFVLNVADWQAQSIVSGPGVRFVLWLQGCAIRCPGCINEDFLSFEPRRLLTVDEVYDSVCSTPGIAGVTYSGGEPMHQAPALSVLSERLRQVGYTVVCYTGYTIEQLLKRSDENIIRLLRNTDILIDGPYVANLSAPLLWRGSANQRVHFLTDAYREWIHMVQQEVAEVEFTVGVASMSITGIYDRSLWKTLQERLKSDG